MKCLCLQALAIVYGKCYEEIGPFTDTKYIVGMLDRVSTDGHNTPCVCLVFVFFFESSFSELKLTFSAPAVHRQTRKGQTHSVPEQAYSQQGRWNFTLSDTFC